MHPVKKEPENNISNLNYREYIRELVSSDLPETPAADEFTDEELKLLDKIPTDRMFLMKVVLIGDGAVGKTSIRHKFLGKGFQESYLITIGADFTASPTFEFGSGSLKFQIWDLAGQPSFASVREAYYNGAAGAFIVFDVTKRNSFNNIPEWIHELWQSNGKGPIPFLVLGNKTDLRGSVRGLALEDAEAREFVTKINTDTREKFRIRVGYLPTSAKTGLNIDEAFSQMAINVFLHNAHIEGIS